MEKPTGGQQTSNPKRDDERSNPNRVPESNTSKDARSNPKGSPEPTRGDDDRSNPNRAPQTGAKGAPSSAGEDEADDTRENKTDAQKGGQPNSSQQARR